MSQVFKKQSNLVITLDTGIDLTGATETKILWQRPNGSQGFWNATVSGTTLSRALTDTDIDRYGNWKFQAYVIKGGKKYYGNITEKLFLKPLN